MIYQIYRGRDLIAETDNMDFVKSVVHRYPDCSIRELLTGRVYRPKLVKRRAAKTATSKAGPAQAASVAAG